MTGEGDSSDNVKTAAAVDRHARRGVLRRNLVHVRRAETVVPNVTKSK